MKSVILFSFVFVLPMLFVSTIFAENEIPIISVELVGGNIIDLDAGSQFVRANVDIEFYNPQDGYHFMKVTRISDGEIIAESEIQPKKGPDNIYSAQIMHYIDTTQIDDEILGDYELEISSEFGLVSAGTQFSIIRSSLPQITTNSTNEVLEITSNEIDEELEIETIEEESLIPDWIRNIFVWYAEGTITETDLLSALEFLIGEGIIDV